MLYILIEPVSHNEWVCYNGEEMERTRCLSNGGWVMSQNDAERIFGKYIDIVSPLNTVVSTDGRTIKFTPPIQKELDDNTAYFMRNKRNQLLSSTDYLLLQDYPISEDKKQAIEEYRQALRDITKQDGWPNNITWPEKPSI